MTEEINISQHLINNGFKFDCGNTKSTENFDPKNNFFGVSVYQPEVRFFKGEKEVLISLQGPSTPHEAYDLHKELCKKMAIKIIKFTNNSDIIYNTYTGILPSKEVINQFINL